MTFGRAHFKAETNHAQSEHWCSSRKPCTERLLLGRRVYPFRVFSMHPAWAQVMCMTNGSVEIATGVLQKAGVDSLVDAVMDVAQCSAWKPAPTAYQYAVWSPGFKLQPSEVCAPALVPVFWPKSSTQRPAVCNFKVSGCGARVWCCGSVYMLS